MKISLFIPCFIDQLFPSVGISAVRIFEKLGHKVEFDESIVCCGQPAFNTGCWDEARSIATRVVERLENAEVVVIPSGSCGAMIRVFYPEIFKDHPKLAAAQSLAQKTYELSEFLVDCLGVTDLGSRFLAKVTFHDGCHGLRELHLKQQARQLLKHVKGLSCGACLNVCPIFRNVGGQSYGTTYQGPIGSVITPHLRGLPDWKHLSFASSLCGACSETCPVKIDLHHHLLQNRRNATALESGQLDRISFQAFAFLVNHPGLLEVVAKFGRLLRQLHRFVAGSKIDPLWAWTATREAPIIAKESFRQYWRSRF